MRPLVWSLLQMDPAFYLHSFWEDPVQVENNMYCMMLAVAYAGVAGGDLHAFGKSC